MTSALPLLALTVALASATAAHAQAPAGPPGTAGGQPASGRPSVVGWHAARDAYWTGDKHAESLLREVASSPTASPVMRRDANHLLARLLSGRPETSAAAITAWREALALALGEAPSQLKDLLRYGLARALVDSGSPSDEPQTLLAAVDKDPFSPLRADAAFLRARHLEALGRLREAKKAYGALLSRWPDAVFAPAAKTRLSALEVAGQAESGARRELQLASAETPRVLRADERRVPLATIAFWLQERKFDLIAEALAPWLVEPPPGAPKAAVDTWLDALELALDDHYENFRFDDALLVSEKLRKNKRPGLSKPRETRLYALDGDFDKARAQLKRRFRGKGYQLALGDLAFEFARYDEAYNAYAKALGKRGEPSERMVWCLLRMGKADKALKNWERLGKTRGFNRNLYQRYWYGRALQLADKPGHRAIFEALVEDAPLEYYGLQAWSRLQEITGTVPEGVAPPTPTVPRKGTEPEVGKPTVAWSDASLLGAFDKAPRPAAWDSIAPVAHAFAERWGAIAQEARRADELVELGDLSGAVSELRVIDMDLRAARISGGTLAGRARSDLLDNRSTPRARGGAPMKESATQRKSPEHAAAMKRSAGDLRKDLRALQVLLADPYGTRRSVLEDQWVATPELLAEKGTALYPIAYPEVIAPLTQQFGLPPYYVYAIMTVESAFHPGAVSVSNAYGLVQVIPRTGENLARELGFVDFTPERLLDPAVSIYFGGYYLARLLARFHGQEPLASAAYNAGPHRVASWLLARGRIPMDMFIEDIPYDQARGYTKTVLEHVAAYRRIYHGEEHIYIRNVIDPTMGDGPNY